VCVFVSSKHQDIYTETLVHGSKRTSVLTKYMSCEYDLIVPFAVSGKFKPSLLATPYLTMDGSSPLVALPTMKR
jgi:hypothetical protein